MYRNKGTASATKRCLIQKRMKPFFSQHVVNLWKSLLQDIVENKTV